LILAKAEAVRAITIDRANLRLSEGSRTNSKNSLRGIMKNLKRQTAMYKKQKINRLIDLNSSLNLLSTLNFYKSISIINN